MTRSETKPGLRRFGLYGLILLALTLVSAVVFVIATDNELLGTDDVFVDALPLDPEKRPNFVFPESVRTYDTSLNRFIDRFVRICMQGRYSEYRLMHTNRAEPISADRFASIYHAVKETRILAVEALPDLPDLAGIDGPVYIMLSEYDLEDYADPDGARTRRIRVAITKEGGRWRIGSIPGDLLDRLQAVLKGSSDSGGAGQPDAPATRPAEPHRLKPRANRPDRVGS
ncbi:MAG: hypothetical protein ACE5F9_11915 [Phycisphaerae bacterium]